MTEPALVSEYGEYGLPATSALYVDGLDVTAVGQALVASANPSQQVANTQRFWSTPAYGLKDPKYHALIVTLAKPKKINYIELEVARFPHHVYFSYWDLKRKRWTEFVGPKKASTRIYMDGSTPQVIGPAMAYQTGQHPSHYGAGHWIHYSLDLTPVVTNKIRIRMTRRYGSKKGGPKDTRGRPAKYSLGVRNLDLGWRIRTPEQIPHKPRDPDILTERESFTQVFDMLGSPIEMRIRENRASDLLRGGIWKSEPMPVPYAVVNFYVDARDSVGEAQTIDRFNIKPLTSGAHLNLYYATEVPDSTFEATDSPIVFPALRPAGEQEPIAGPSGILFPSKIGYIDLDNQAIQWTLNKPFWMAMEFQPQFPSTDTGTHIIFDTGVLQLAWVSGVWRLTYDDGWMEQQTFEFGFNARLRAVVAFDGEKLYFYMPESVGVMMAESDMSGIATPKIRFGAEQGVTSAPIVYNGLYRLNAMVIKTESATFANDENGLVVPEGIQRFLEDAPTYLAKPEFQEDDDGSTHNAILRYYPALSTGTFVNPYGFVGGPGTIFEDVVWTPVARDYKLRAGTLQFHPVKAKFFKFEFTDLVPEPYETYQPISRTIKVFSPQASIPVKTPEKTYHTMPINVLSAGMQINMDVGSVVGQFADTVSKTASTARDILPTEALYARDPSIQERLDSMGTLYGFQSWQQGTQAPSYTTTARHVYQMVTVGHNKRVAYFAGLAKLEMIRVDYETEDDTEQYVELFDDVLNLDPEYLTKRIVIGTTNFVTNPSFGADTTGYTLYTAGTATGGAIASITDASEAKFGTKALRVYATTLGSAGTDRVGWEQTYTTPSPSLANSVAYSIYARRLGGIGSLRLSLEYYDIGAVFLSSDSQSFTLQPEVGSNLITNGGFTTDTSGWEASTGATISRDTVTFHTTPASLKITPDGATATVSGQLASTGKIPVTAGSWYQAIGWLHSPAGWADSSLAVDWYSTDQESSYLSTTLGVAKQLPAATWMQRYETFKAPAGATYAKLRVRHAGTPAITDVLYADDLEFKAITGDIWTRCTAVKLPPANANSVKVRWWVESGDGSAGVEYRFDGHQIQNLRITDYIDGSISGAYWNGTADASTSTRDPITIRPWKWDGDKLVATADLIDPVTTMSRRFPSRRRVRAVQFASTQTQPSELVSDPDFLDPTLAAWAPEGDTLSMEISEDFSSTIGSAVKLYRSSSINTWEEISATYASYSEIETSNPDSYSPTYLDLEGGSGTVGYGGIKLRNAVQVSSGGRVWAAARVYSDHALSGPLHLQITNETGEVLAEKIQPVDAGKIMEWYVGYTIGDNPSVTATWDSIMAQDPSPTLPTYGDLEANRWIDLTSDEIATARNLSVRIVQHGPGEDTWYVDSLTLFEDPILWEFSNDDGASWWPALNIRNNPNGVLVFPNDTSHSTADPTGLRWRVTGYRGNLNVSALVIRPWYGETTFGIPHREPGISGGPNIQPTDHYDQVTRDPFFQQWHLPIPQSWFFFYRQLLLLRSPQTPVTPVIKPTVFGDLFRASVPIEVVPPVPPYIDSYTETYPNAYGIDSSSGTFVDEYDPGNDY